MNSYEGSIAERASRSVHRSVLWSGLFTIIAACCALFPAYDGLNPAARWMLFIVILAAGLWVTEAIPVFATGILVIGLEIAIFGRPGGVFAKTPTDWELFVRPWSSPVMWLFFGGFVMAEAAAKTRLDARFSRYVLRCFGTRPAIVLLGIMVVTFVFSMFVSNTATTVMMISVVAPIVCAGNANKVFARATLVGIPFAANVGGMATVIGTPPNAIAVGNLAAIQPIHFVTWIWAALPPALVLFAVSYGILAVPCAGGKAVELGGEVAAAASSPPVPVWRCAVVMVTFAITVLSWITEPLHGVPTTVVSFLPITVFAVTGIIGTQEVRRLPWDVLLLIAGGLALGVGITETGLADWLVTRIPGQGLTVSQLALILAIAVSVLSNVMSNTAAANILIPIAMRLVPGSEAQLVIPIALGASSSMCLPISTPPNAIAYGQGVLKIRDLLIPGAMLGLLAPPVIVFWCNFALR